MTDEILTQIAASLERIARQPRGHGRWRRLPPPCCWGEADAYHWDAAADRLMPVEKVARIPFGLPAGIDRSGDTLLGQHAAVRPRRMPANNALLTGARGMGKSFAGRGACRKSRATSPTA